MSRYSEGSQQRAGPTLTAKSVLDPDEDAELLDLLGVNSPKKQFGGLLVAPEAVVEPAHTLAGGERRKGANRNHS